MPSNLTTVRRVWTRRAARGEPAVCTPVANPCFHELVDCDALRRQLSDAELLRAVQESGALHFWNGPAEDVYTPDDGEPV